VRCASPSLDREIVIRDTDRKASVADPAWGTCARLGRAPRDRSAPAVIIPARGSVKRTRTRRRGHDGRKPGIRTVSHGQPHQRIPGAAVRVVRAYAALLSLNLRRSSRRSPRADRDPGCRASLVDLAAAAGAEVFVRDGCPHCADAKVSWSGSAGDARAAHSSTGRSTSTRRRATRWSSARASAGIWPPGVPTFVYADRLLVGFDDAEHSGPSIRADRPRSRR